jgi:hypothetical protein
LRSTVQRWRRVESGVFGQTAVRVTALVNVGFGIGLRAPTQGDGNLIHARRDSAHTNRPRPHHDLGSVSVARQMTFIALQ